MKYGYSQEEIDKRVADTFTEIFERPWSRFYFEGIGDTGYFMDTGNCDARTEGMSYGMLMSVLMDRKDIFDRMWKFAMDFMYMREGPMAGYFAWSVGPDGKRMPGDQPLTVKNFLQWHFSLLVASGAMQKVTAFIITPGGPAAFCIPVFIIKFLCGMPTTPIYFLCRVVLLLILHIILCIFTIILRCGQTKKTGSSGREQRQQAENIWLRRVTLLQV